MLNASLLRSGLLPGTIILIDAPRRSPGRVSFESTIGFALTDHLLTVGIQGIIHYPLSRILLMVILEAKVTEALRDGLQSLSFRLAPKGIVGIGAVDDLAQKHQRRVTDEVVLLEDSLKRTLLAVMAQFHIFHIIGCGPLALCHLHHLVGWHKQELGIL